MYSLISILIRESLLLNNSSPRDFASWVLPIPVWPKNIKDPIGLLGSLSPVLFLCIAFTTASTASSWPIILSFILLSKLNSITFSVWSIFRSGTPEISETTSIILSSETNSLFFFNSSSHIFCWSKSSFSIFFSSSLNLAASSYFWFLTTEFFFIRTDSNLFSKSTISFGTSIFVMWTLEPASSIASMALSGRFLSFIYLSVNLTHASIASSVYFTLWWSSYLCFISWRIWIVSLTDVGSTIIFWNLLSSAPSFSIYFLYSSSVVAPIHWISPLAKAGLNMFEASKLPIAPPAPTIVWISSMNKIISLFFSISFITAFILSSNCPLYFVPATTLARSNEITLLLYKSLETFLSTILRANPSAIADFPTPGSPMSSGLFFFLLLKIWDTLSISLWRPIIGSSFPSEANNVKSLPKLSSTGVLDFFVLFEFCLTLKGFCSIGFSSSSCSSSNVCEEVISS